jgi:YD repeat-containing protein
LRDEILQLAPRVLLLRVEIHMYGNPRKSSCLIMLLLLLGSLAATPGAAKFLPRYDDARLERMDYWNSSGELGRTVYIYGRDGVLRFAVWLLDDSSRSSANYHLYDGAGREIEQYREFSDSVIVSEHYEYDGAGHRVLERFERSDGRVGTARNAFDSLGRLSSSECDKYKGWFTGRIEYEYAGQRLTGARVSKGEKEIGAIEYVYDEAGRLRKETWKFIDSWSQTFSYVYECIPAKVYSASSPLLAFNPKFRVTGETYDYNRELGGPSHYRYDAEGRLIEKVFERTDGLTTTTSFEFDGTGNLISSHRRYSSGKTADFVYRYNDRLQLEERTFKRSDGATGFERYNYDRLGRLVSARYDNMDFCLTGNLSFSYDKWGRLSAGRYQGDGGLNANLRITADNDSNVLSVQWTFSDGTTQTYNFTYTRLDCPQAAVEKQ